MSPRSQKERQPRLARITLSAENFDALQRALDARGVRGVTGAESVILNEWIARGRGDLQPAAPALHPAEPDQDEGDDFGFKL